MPCSICFLLFLLFSCNSALVLTVAKDRAEWETGQVFPSIHRVLIDYFRYELDSIDPPTTSLPNAPVTLPPPVIVTVPGTNPNPTTTAPVTNPVTTPTTTNPVTTPTAGASQGQSWCVAKNGASQAALQSALDYACGIGGADCSTIQQGASCYNPTTLQYHASYAFNSYYQKNPVPTSCDFGGVASVTNVNPSTGSCVFPSSSSPTTPTTPTTPMTQAPANPTPMPSSSGSNLPGTMSPPPGFSLGNPGLGTGLGGFGASPPLTDTSSVSSPLQPFIGSVVIVASIMGFGL